MATKSILIALIGSILLMTAAAQHFLGCCLDHNATDLTYKIYWGNLNTNLNCADWCVRAGYQYGGTKNGNECWCGNQYCTNGRLDPSSCNKPCAGDKNTMCGAVAITSVYKPPVTLMGCFVDDVYNPDLPVFMRDVLQATDCITRCAGYTYAAIEFGFVCHCGNSYGKYGQVADSECSVACSTGSLPCGGTARNSVFRL